MIRAIIVDDEKPAINALQDLLSEYDDIELVGQFMNPYQALSRIGELAFDIAFLDIEMPEMNGLELGERLLEADPSKDIIYITAYDAYAVEAFEVCALDYLLKPVSPRRMKKTLERLRTKQAGAKEISEPPLGGNPCRVLCFGRFEVVLEGEDGLFIPWRIAKVRELLAYLVHFRGQIVRKSNILEALWPELEVDRAAVYLHTCIYQIRKTLKQYRMAKHLEVRFIRDGYQLTVHPFDCDVDVFLRGISSGERAEEPTLEALEAAEQLYGSGYYAQDDFPWALGSQRELEAKYMEAVKRLAQHDSVQDRDLLAIRRWSELARLDPYNEEYHEQLLRLYAKTGERALVIRQYNQMVELLRDELDIDPRPAAVELYRSLLSSMEQRGTQE
jgi:two-component system LytT family response regulator